MWGGWLKILKQNFVESLIAVLVGNALYFLLAPALPEAARHNPQHFDLGLAVDFWVCLLVLGCVRMLGRMARRPHR